MSAIIRKRLNIMLNKLEILKEIVDILAKNNQIWPKTY